ncbi:hypothetical protein ACOMHN_006018 [Nucella lapillus]
MAQTRLDNLRHLTLPSVRCPRMDTLMTGKNLKGRTLTAVGYPDWSHLLPNIKLLPNLTAVDLSRSQVFSISTVVHLLAQHCQSLEKLVLRAMVQTRCPWKRSVHSSIKGLRLRPLMRLKHLDLSGNGAQMYLTHDRLKSLLDRHQSLETLSIDKGMTWSHMIFHHMANGQQMDDIFRYNSQFSGPLIDTRADLEKVLELWAGSPSLQNLNLYHVGEYERMTGTWNLANFTSLDSQAVTNYPIFSVLKCTKGPKIGESDPALNIKYCSSHNWFRYRGNLSAMHFGLMGYVVQDEPCQSGHFWWCDHISDFFKA